jgi:hypothetical protein
MQGLILMTWEKYLAERFGSAFLTTYREAIGQTLANLPLAHRLYDDAMLLAGVSAASQLTQLSTDTLLREYGRYFLLNGVTSHLCTYLLSQVHSGRDLLLTMREAHARLRCTFEGTAAPLFTYEASSRSNTVILTYESPRHLCSVLRGAIEGAAERYGEQVHIIEHSCMKQGASKCRFEARFVTRSSACQESLKTPEQLARQRVQKELADLVLAVLPDARVGDGLTLAGLQGRLQQRQHVHPHHLRPALLLEALYQLQFAGLVMSNAHSPGDDFARRRYWRVPTTGT